MELKVFLSSTSDDLKEFRAAARLAVLDLQWFPEMMEHFPAAPGYTIDACCGKVDECDLVLLIVAWKQGWVPAVEQGGNGKDSITALEIAHADKKGIPVLTLLANDDWPGRFWDKEESKQTWIRSFRDNLNRLGQFFEYEKGDQLPNFRTAVKQNLLAYKDKLLRDKPPAADPNRAALDPKIIERARVELADGNRTPVLGCGIYGRGPLSSSALVKALRGDSQRNGDQRERMPLATAAEYYERTLSRGDFLQYFSEIVSQQAAQVAASPMLDLLARSGRVKTFISATYDTLAEDRLRAGGRLCTMISHVLRLNGQRGENAAAQGDYQPAEGKVMVVRPGKAPEFYWADSVPLDPEECVVYKPQGSAVPTVIPDADCEADTGVITETDYAVFLRYLGSRQTGVPASLMTRLRRAPLIFLGYTMDEWQYRLITLLFQSIGRPDKRILSVRIPDNEVEKAAWGGLNACLIEMDPNQFASGGSLVAASTP
jgi:hypothetical protein